jgi:hypothetical protein
MRTAWSGSLIGVAALPTSAVTTPPGSMLNVLAFFTVRVRTSSTSPVT